MASGNLVHNTNSRIKRYRAPLIIAAGVFLISLLFFTGWKVFFDRSIEGTWQVNMTSADGNKSLKYDLTFSDDQTVRLHNGGVSCIGRYYFIDREEYGDVIAIYINQSGTPYIAADFGYSFAGNAITGRILQLTDYSGLFFSPDQASADPQSVEEKKSITGSIVKDDATYYVWDFRPAVFENVRSEIPDPSTDKPLTGSWLYADPEKDDSYTLTFSQDGTFEQFSYDTEITGSYSADGEKIKLSIVAISGNPVDTEVEYSIKDDKLIYNNLSLTRTDDKYAFKSEIK